MPNRDFFICYQKENRGGIDVTQYRDRLKAFRNTQGYRDLEILSHYNCHPEKMQD